MREWVCLSSVVKRKMYIVLEQEPDDGIVSVTMPMPADYRTSYSGSALTFPREDMAFSETSLPKRNHLPTSAPGTHSMSTLQLTSERVPNWYYRNGIYGPPYAKVAYHVEGRLVKKMLEIHGVPRMPGRSLTAQHRFLTTSADPHVRTQEQTLRLRGMPGSMCHEATDDEATVLGALKKLEIS